MRNYGGGDDSWPPVYATEGDLRHSMDGRGSIWLMALMIGLPTDPGRWRERAAGLNFRTLPSAVTLPLHLNGGFAA